MIKKYSLDKNLEEYGELLEEEDIFDIEEKEGAREGKEEVPIWLSVSEAAKLGGVGDKTIRRAIKEGNTDLEFKIDRNKYLINFKSLIKFLFSNTKLKNKLNDNGVGQYVRKWKK